MGEIHSAAEEKQRIAWIDLAKGLALLCIVYGHASRNVGLLSRAVYTFHVPMCVFLSGLLYQYKHQSLGVHLKKTGRRLLIPYLFFSLVSIVIYMGMGRLAAASFQTDFYSLKDNLIFMVTGRSIGNAALWYLPFLFLTYLIMELLCRSLQGRKIDTAFRKGLVIALPLAVSAILLTLYTRYQYVYNLDLPFGINNACFLFFFFWLGFVLKSTLSLPEKKIFLLPALVLLAGSIFLGLRFNDEVEYMRLLDCDYGSNIPVFYLSAAGSTLSLCWICRIIGKNRLLQWFGRHSMSILLMHKFPVLFFQVILGDVGERFGQAQSLWYLLISIASMAMCCGVGEILLRTVPIVIGEKKRT